ncbi:putative SNF2 family helicase [Aspergillus aculeatinus CBS 121060]|uniref:Uncharacterized protein n=1 Tax=Aspergillus aculeatinus CBS 121060 TaxID=1448322 RepID=A0ACD1H5W2_9EURO|nr:hypothetical protein BO66DRAFT_351874 [Aspergillus aculeatinus CBS 121060]RAH69183.1 hypothetical protein BO66DRAFT_351874 [Aspergillus aculeatinus CBS 121060]
MPVVSSASSGAVNADPQSVNLAHEGEEAEWLDDELDAIAQQDLSDAKFQAAKRHFQSLANPSMEDKIRLEAARMEDEARKRRVAAKEAFEAENQSRNSNYEDSGAISDEQVSVDVVAQSWKETVQPSQDTAESRGQGQQLRVPRNRKNRLSAEEKRKSKKYGFESEFLKVLKAPNVIEDAHASASAQAMPEFSEKNKEKAFTQMIASIPAADLAEAKSDRNKIREASRRFRKIARLDGKGGYRIPGLKTSLYHYQLQGAAFMRDRENSSVQPLGGFLCDFMGFGKTIQALANIVDGRPTDPNDPIYTTLIIVPSPLVTHWNNQIINHCDGIDGSEVLTYDARTRLNTLDTAKSLQKYSVIITTYEEVRRSYPKCSKLSVPSGSQEEVSAWWDKHYEENVGPLHKIKFLRIILDEGHMIKNHASAVSIAVRALTGLYKWILTGTPIHNYLDELYPQFDFLGVPGTQDHEKFFKDFCRDENGHSRLVNLLRSFMFRRTHASRLFTFPIVKLPDVKDRTISVRFCDAERVIYNAIQDVFFERFNKCAEEKHPKLAQYRCSLTMILKLRMFCSHLLTAHDMIKALLSKGTLMSKLGRMSNQQKDPQDPSFIIIQRLISVRTNPTAISDKEKEHLGHSTSLQGDKEKLVKNYYEYMRRLHDEEEWDERLERNECPQCRSIPVYPVITSCHHLYCEECYSSLSVNESPGQDKPTCCTCQEPIQEAAYYDMDEELETQQTQREVPKTQSKRKGATKRKSQKSFRGSASINANMEPTSVSDADEETDWIQACAGQMPSAKLTKLRELIAQWLAESPKNKVVVFTQFLDFVRIMHIMCQTQGWSAACLTGKMNLAKREASMKQFSDVNGNTNIMLASLKAGGIGLDLTAANKCILIDLWWNEAIQDQAFCRLWRHGQTQEVEYVKLIVEDTIDDHLLNLQRAKMTEIDETIGDGVLEDRATMKFLLEMFADVEVEDNGIYRLSRKGTEKNKPRARSNGKGKKKQDDPPDESETES